MKVVVHIVLSQLTINWPYYGDTPAMYKILNNQKTFFYQYTKIVVDGNSFQEKKIIIIIITPMYRKNLNAPFIPYSSYFNALFLVLAF